MMMANIFEMKSSSFIINHDGSYITNPKGKRIMKDNFFSHLESCDGTDAEGLINKMKNGIASEDRGQEKYLVSGEECYLFYTPIKYTQWVLVSVVPCRAVDILSQLNAAMLLLIFLLAILIIIFAGYYYIKNGIYPLKQLTKVANDIASGKFDTPMPEMKHNDEICQLRDSIEEMQYRLSNHADNGRKS
jgi:methyl-accepting chemotaxis protein